MNTIALSFASSEGWMPRPPIENQRRALFTAGAEEHRDEGETDDAEARPDEDRLAIPAVVDPHHHAEDRDAEHRPHQLLGEEEIGLAVPLVGHDRGRAVDHDDAQATSRMVVRNKIRSDLSFRAIQVYKAGPHFTRNTVSGQQSSVGLG